MCSGAGLRVPASTSRMSVTTAAETGVGVFEMEFAASAPERQQFMPIVEWIETPKIVVETNAPSLLPFHPAISVPGRAGLRVVTKSFPAP